jgi:hypothetical protein
VLWLLVRRCCEARRVRGEAATLRRGMKAWGLTFVVHDALLSVYAVLRICYFQSTWLLVLLRRGCLVCGARCY